MTADHRVETVDGAALADALATAARWVDRNADALNALNVYPVPDGDTGLNMSLTLKSAVETAQDVRTRGLAEVAEAMARGALMGARGNSGVILAQILRGIARSLQSQTAADAPTLASALAGGAQAGYQALANPVEGTILTVARRAAEAAREASATQDLVATLTAAHSAARVAVEETPELLPVLKQASVVDAGGEGYRVFLEGLLKHLRGEELPKEPAGVTIWADLEALHHDEGDFYGYCTEVLFQGDNLDLQETRERVSALGTSVLVVGDDRMLKVHVHTLRPGAVLDLATELGELVKVKVDNMQLQHQEFAASASRAAAPPTVQPGTGIVAVASGSGLEALVRDLGATVVPGGETMNPSVEQLAQGVRACPWEQVIILPNNKNVILAAEQAASLLNERLVRVVPTRSVAHGIAAMLALNPEEDADFNLPRLTAAAGRCHVIELARASRDANVDGIQVARDQFLALLDDRAAAAAESPADVLQATLGKLSARPTDCATIYVGRDGSAAEANLLASIIEQQLALPAEIVEGGQPSYPFVIALE